MRSSRLIAALSGLLSYTQSFAAAKTQSYCPENDVCYSVAVPETSASSGSGPVFFQLQAPSTYSWVAMAQGDSMIGSNMFIMYSDGSGNVTVSPRMATRYSTPQENTTPEVTLLAGSGVTDGTMVANIRCDNCQSWDGGEMSFSSTSASFVAAWRTGSPIDSTSKSASISQHNGHQSWSLDLTQASVSGNTDNPFVGKGSDNTGSGSGDGDSNSGVVAGPSGGGSSGGSSSTMISAHGIIMSVVMIVLYPLGSALMPLFGKWYFHAAWQTVAFLLMWAGFALGYVVAQSYNMAFKNAHTTFGTIVVALFGVQPIVGYMHHLHFVKHRTRGAVSHVHIWYGRALLIMGIVNGGLGLQLAHAGSEFITAYAVVAAVAMAIYAASKVFGTLRKRRVSRVPGTQGIEGQK